MKTQYKKINQFTAVSMPCTQEQWNELEPILREYEVKVDYVGDFENSDLVLVNNTDNKTLIISVLHHSLKNGHNRQYHPTHNKELFLSSCGIIPIESETFKISAKEIREARKNPEVLESMFPSAFEPLKEGYYFASCFGTIGYLCYFKNPNDKNPSAEFYIINDDYYTGGSFSTIERKATPQEVTEALTKEVWRKFKVGDKVRFVSGTTTTIEGMLVDFDFENNIITLKDGRYRYELFNNGTWATIINKPQPKELTVKEAEELIEMLGQTVKIKA